MKARDVSGTIPSGIVTAAHYTDVIVVFAIAWLLALFAQVMILGEANTIASTLTAAVIAAVSATRYERLARLAIIALVVVGAGVPAMLAALSALPAFLSNGFDAVGAAIGGTQGLEADAGRTVIARVLAFVLAAAAIWHAFRTIPEKRGSRNLRFPVSLSVVLIVGLPTLFYFLSGAELAFDPPELQGFNFRGGWTAPPELTALIFGLVVYTAAFIAEIVRAGIQAVNYGQTEAAASLGLKDGDRLRLVIIPQAQRIIVPPLTSQYLNLTKNSSLGAAIGFPELVNVFVGTALNQSGRAIEIIGMTMLVYLTFSLATSLFMNWYNARVALVER
ncbi:ABC transporter permease subunit [Pelagibacterium limicola]|uniref:ABC transporter permease subunit n=1 Tax=Pelagibacterium limicola TaxID=2791022 RepID=UPI0031B60E8C